MFATFAGGYSRRPNPGLPDVFREADAHLADGSLNDAGFQEIADEFVREIVNEQQVVGLAIVGEGGVRAPDRALPLIDGLGGVTRGERTTLPDGEPVSCPTVAADATSIRWTAPIHARDWQFVDGLAETIVKQTLLGPYTLATLAEPSDARRRADLAAAFGEALNAEVQALRDIGCGLIEVDEPYALQIGDRTAEWAALRDANERLAAGIDPEQGPHLSLGLWGGQIDPAGHRTLIDLPYVSYLVDVLAGPSAWRFIRAVPPDRGIVVGSADITTEHMDDQEVHVWAMAWAARDGRGNARVGCAPNGALWSLPRHFAHRKCLRLGEAVKIAGFGPLDEVAMAVDERPLTSKIDELRALAQAYEAAASS